MNAAHDRWSRAHVIVVACLLGIVWFLYASLDVAAPWVSTRPPVISLFLMLGSFATTPLLIGRARGIRHGMATIALFAIFLGGIAARYRANPDPRKPFARACGSIRTGMTTAQVDAVFRAQFGGRLPFNTRSANHISYILDPDDGRYNSEIISVSLSNGRVVSTDYLPD